jgi:hypothetical protein
MDARCSYADAAGGQVVQISGRLMAQTTDPLPTPLSDTSVAMYEIEAEGDPPRLGRLVAEVTTDAQGGFSVSLVLDAGSYVLQVEGLRSPIASRRFEVAPGQSAVGDLVVWLPLDPALAGVD